ncbi:MAG: FadR family transcriptional regulator [Firmicutes bacterium]|nr:FadR family transcriptional regulator [Bacillota bacterium]
MDIRLRPVPTQKASEAIYRQIEELILSGQISPGDRLPSERAMMEMLGRSRPTIREALRMLERNGLIQTIPGSRGAVVLAPDSLSVEEPLENMLNLSLITGQELLEYRELNEVAAAVWAAQRRSPEDLDKIKAALDALDPEPSQFKDFSELDIAFHRAIADAGHNRVSSMVDRVIHRLVANILEKSHAAKSPEDQQLMMQQIRRSHRDIYDAIAAGSPEAARAAMIAHMRLFEKDILSV